MDGGHGDASMSNVTQYCDGSVIILTRKIGRLLESISLKLRRT